jgi:hypothetical protein
MMLSGPTAERSSRSSARPLDPEYAWTLLGYIGIAFVLVGAIDIVLAWFPFVLGSAEWEFGTIGATLNGLPLPGLGLMLLLAGGVGRDSKGQVRVAAMFCAILVVALLVLGFLYVTVIPVALSEVTNPVVRAGLMKSIVKALSLLVIYPVLFGWVAYRGFKLSFPK